MAYIYGCSVCGTSATTTEQRSLRCSKCGERMDEIAREEWLMKCHSCGYEATTAAPSVSPCPMCDGQLCPSRPA